MSYQKTIIMGRLGKDPELKFKQNGSAIAKANVATTRVWFDNESQKREDTEWHNVTLFGPSAENFEKFLKKGNQVLIEGRNKTSTYEKDGVKHYRTEVIVEIFKLIDSKKQQPSEENSEEKPKQQQKVKQKPKTKKQEQEPELPPDYPDDSFSGDEDLSSQNNDEIPF